MRLRTYVPHAFLTAISILAPAPVTTSEVAFAQETSKPPSVRDVTPSGVNRIYRSNDTSALVEAGWPRFSEVQVLANGNLRSGERTIQLHGIVLPERKKLCVSPGGRWTCGATAFVALRNLAQDRTIACNVIAESEKAVLGQCKVEQTDIALSLLRDGWAELAPGTNEKAYVDAARDAKARSVGLWSIGPPSTADKPLKR